MFPCAVLIIEITLSLAAYVQAVAQNSFNYTSDDSHSSQYGCDKKHQYFHLICTSSYCGKLSVVGIVSLICAYKIIVGNDDMVI